MQREWILMYGESRGTSARVLRGIGAVVLGGAGLVAGVTLGPVHGAGAVGTTVTVTFGDSGPTPASPVRLTAGDTVVFVNKITQTGSLVLPNVIAQVQSVSVSVHGAAASDFVLPAYNKSVSLTYPSAGSVSYTAKYTYKLLPLLNPLGINLVPDSTSRNHQATLAIAAAPVQQEPSQPATGGGAQQPGSGGVAGGGAPAGGAQAPNVPAPNAPAPNAPAGGAPAGGYQPQGPSVADGTVPHGSGTGGRAANDARPRTPLTPPQVHGGTVLPNPHDTEAILTGSAPNAGLGLPAVLAIILLSVVTAALVRALINQRRTAEI
jgi:plastocyanin